MARAFRLLPLLAGAVYLAVLALVAWWPTHVDAGLGVVDWRVTRGLATVLGISAGSAYAVIEVSANVALFVPFGVLVAWWGGWAWWRVAIIGALVSTVIEAVQAVAPLDRTASVGDVLANTAGAALGALVARWVLRRRLVR
ncbi:hypothetical protein BHE97_02710 [Aeromicrobium sp. PE09-221]|uniref:VanZ family protein n=1 Tax=Aeromicrobium sp. PE09-221 TaxID=1898043 RepID=UPI000B6A40AC|nr:VanZ family protein [Aeromicrobium sp. PE09-221]OUZ12123.1 hypothetical protein BHE97_02710 [Aeromicrobium sp. PE09-221]